MLLPAPRQRQDKWTRSSKIMVANVSTIMVVITRIAIITAVMVAIRIVIMVVGTIFTRRTITTVIITSHRIKTGIRMIKVKVSSLNRANLISIPITTTSLLTNSNKFCNKIWLVNNKKRRHICRRFVLRIIDLSLNNLSYLICWQYTWIIPMITIISNNEMS